VRNRNYILLFLIFVLGIFLRFYRLGEIPTGFHVDEAYLGYNAYSILNTGREMAGLFLPLNLKSFLFSPAGYSYFSIPFILLFGLSEFSVRFASAFFGSLTIVLVYFLTTKILHEFKNNEKIALISSFLFAISPWSLNLSRVATENVIAAFLILLGVFLYIKWTEENKIYLLLIGMISFLISIYTYQAPRSFLPIFLPLLFIVYSWRNKKNLIISFVFYLLLIIAPVISIMFSQELALRLRMLSIFNSPSTQMILGEKLREDGVMGIPAILARVFDNKLFSYLSTFTLNYFDHFSFRFLFQDQGFPDRYRVYGQGILYLFDLPLLLLGIWSILRKKRTAIFILGWILIAPIGSALTYDDIPNMQRTFVMLPAIAIISALGLFYFWNYLTGIKRGMFKIGIKVILVVLIFFGLLNYLFAYYVHQVSHRPWFRQDGYRQMVGEVDYLLKKNHYKKVVVTSSQSNPALFFIFYNKVDPTFVQKLFKKVDNGNYGQANYEKLFFSNEECPLKEVLVTNKQMETSPFVKGELGVLYVNNGTCKTPKNGVREIDQIRRPDGTSAFVVVEIEKGANILSEEK
jgi:4-amino-4-deoxy-L-arabinose transferase-like glycosyltransferase